MSIYVLVYGAWHGAWCWYKVMALLEKAGHTVFETRQCRLHCKKGCTQRYRARRCYPWTRTILRSFQDRRSWLHICWRCERNNGDMPPNNGLEPIGNKRRCLWLSPGVIRPFKQ